MGIEDKVSGQERPLVVGEPMEGGTGSGVPRGRAEPWGQVRSVWCCVSQTSFVTLLAVCRNV